MHMLLQTLSQKYNNLAFAMIEAESAPSISEKYGVSVVPTFTCLDGSKLLFKLEGVNPPELGKLIKRAAEDPSQFSVSFKIGCGNNITLSIPTLIIGS